MFTKPLRPLLVARTEKHRAQELYIALSRQSRNPFFYTDCAVADTLDGRFDMLVLHVFLYMQNTLPSAPAPDAAQKDSLAQLLLEAFFSDMDRSLREMGVGDTGIAKRMRAMSEAAFGRFKAYKEAWGSDEELRGALVRNVYREQKPAQAILDKLMEYMRNWRAG